MYYLLIAAIALVAGVASLIPLTASTASDAPKPEEIELLAARPIPEGPRKRLVSILVHYPPGAASVPHRHPDSALIYAHVLSGEVKSQVDDEPARVYRAGEWWFENPGVRHRVSANASKRRPARLLAIFIVDADATELTTPDPQATTN